MNNCYQLVSLNFRCLSGCDCDVCDTVTGRCDALARATIRPFTSHVGDENIERRLQTKVYNFTIKNLGLYNFPTMQASAMFRIFGFSGAYLFTCFNCHSFHLPIHTRSWPRQDNQFHQPFPYEYSGIVQCAEKLEDLIKFQYLNQLSHKYSLKTCGESNVCDAHGIKMQMCAC